MTSNLKIQRVAPGELGGLLHSGLGLIVGPGATMPGLLAQFTREVLGQDEVPFFYAAVSAAMDANADLSEQSVQEKLLQSIQKARPDSAASSLAKFPWSAVMSCTFDSFFESALRSEMQKRSVQKDVTVRVQLADAVPPRTLPVFKLLGDCETQTLAVSDQSYRQRRVQWRPALACFTDLVKSNPVFVVGMSEFDSVMQDLVAELGGLRQLHLPPLILLDTDPLLSNRAFVRAMPEGATLVSFSGSVSDMVAGSLRERKTGLAPSLPYGESQDDYSRLAEFDSLVALVNAQVRPTVGKDERNRLQNLLFSPSLLQWDPFCHEMDFRRTMAPQLTLELQYRLRIKPYTSCCCLLLGSAASGKTTLLKRVALDLAKGGTLVLWVRPFYYPDAGRTAAGLFRRLALKAFRDKGPVVVVLDDPNGLGSVSAREIVKAADAEGIPIMLLVAARSSEWATSDDKVEFTGGLEVVVEETMPDVLDGKEWRKLPKFLRALGVVASDVEAEAMVAGALTKSAQDTLSALYLLLPEVRGTLGSSIRQEYVRLGDRDSISRVFSQGARQGSAILQKAYKMIAVAEAAKAPVPIEVLVNALGADYHDWHEASSRQEGGWGLFYSVEDAQSESICYRTRNDVVTKLVVELVNGGQLSHTGEVQELERLLTACTGTIPAYREFCIRMLVGNHRLRHFSFEEGKRLYEAALRALPCQDATILHHFAIWAKEKGYPLEATAVLDRALVAPPYPYADRQEASEHLHTTYAAALLAAMKSGEIDRATARRDITAHLSKARSRDFFNPRAVHVQANLTLSLLAEESEGAPVDQVVLLNRALEDVEKTIKYLDPAVGTVRLTDLPTERDLLVDIRGRLLDVALSETDAQEFAERLWSEQRSQDGFVLVGRKLHGAARRSEFGSDYKAAHDYMDACRQRVLEKSVKLSPDFCAAWVDIYYEWRVTRGPKASSGDVVDWAFVADLSRQARASVSGRDNCNYAYYLGVAHAHLGNWPDSSAAFREARATRLPSWVMWAPRDCLIEPSGNPKKVQGVVTAAGGRTYLKVSELGTDVFADRSVSWPREGETAHAFVFFCLSGPLALPEMEP